MGRGPVDHSWKASAICRCWDIFSQPGRWMALGLLCVPCTSEQAGEITVSIVMACRIRVVAEQEPGLLAGGPEPGGIGVPVATAADGPAVSSVVLLACSALPVEKAYGPL